MNQQQAFLNHIELDANEQAALAAWKNTPAYHAVMKLIHGEVIKAETDCFRAFKEGRETFHDKGAVAVAMRTFMERFDQAVEYQVEQHFGERQARLAEAARQEILENPTFQSIAEGLSNGTLPADVL